MTFPLVIIAVYCHQLCISSQVHVREANGRRSRSKDCRRCLRRAEALLWLFVVVVVVDQCNIVESSKTTGTDGKGHTKLAMIANDQGTKIDRSYSRAVGESAVFGSVSHISQVVYMCKPCL
jgi:hypothetical protein